MKILISLFLFNFAAYAEVYETTENKSLGKFNRININEERVIELSKKLESQKNQFAALKNRLSELEKRVKKLEESPTTKLHE